MSTHSGVVPVWGRDPGSGEIRMSEEARRAAHKDFPSLEGSLLTGTYNIELIPLSNGAHSLSQEAEIISGPKDTRYKAIRKEEGDCSLLEERAEGFIEKAIGIAQQLGPQTEIRIAMQQYDNEKIVYDLKLLPGY